MRDNEQELLPIVDECGNVVDAMPRGKCHDGATKPLHPVVHLHLLDGRGGLYLQKRPEWKKIQPGKWDTAVGGHVGFGESIDEALAREAREELGLTDLTPVKVAVYEFESNVECELVFVFKTVATSAPKPGDEVDEGRFWTFDEIHAAMGKGILTPNFEDEFKRFESDLSGECSKTLAEK